MKIEKWVKGIIFVGVAILLYLPFHFTNDLFFPFITSKAYLFRVVVEIMFFSWLVLAIHKPEYRPKKNWLLYSFTAFIITTLISAFLGVNLENSIWSNFERMEGWVTLVHLFGLFVVLGSVLKKKEYWIWIFNASILASIFMVFSAFGEILEKGFDLRIETIIRDPIYFLKLLVLIPFNGTFGEIIEKGFNFRISTTLGNPIYLAVYMLFNVFLSLYLLFKEKLSFPSWRIWVYGSAFLLQVIVLFQTGTRGAMLGLMGGLILMSLIMIFLNKTNKNIKIASFSIIILISIFVSGIFIFKNSSVVQNIQGLNRVTTISLDQKTVQARIMNWGMAIEGFKEKPIFGWGQSNFNYVFDKYYNPKHYGNEVWFDRVHNTVFDWLIAGGILGLLAYLSLWIIALYLLIKSDKFNFNEKAVLVGLGFAYFFHNLFVFDQIISYVYFILFLSFIYSQSHQNKVVCEKTFSKNIGYIGIFASAILLALTVYFVNLDSYNASTKIIQGLRVFKQGVNGVPIPYHPNGIQDNIKYFREAIELDTYGNSEAINRSMIVMTNIVKSKNISDEDKGAFVEFAFSQMENLKESDPLNPKHPYILATGYASIGNFAKAEENYKKAIELSPTKQYMRMPLIKIYMNTGKVQEAIDLANETYQIEPSIDDLWVEYALAVSLSGKENLDQLINQSMAEGETKRVEKFLFRIISLNEESYQPLISLAAFYFQIGEIDKSLFVLEDTANRFPDVKDQLTKLAEEIKSGGNPLGSSVQ